MELTLDPGRYPINHLVTTDGQDLITYDKESFRRIGMFVLPGFLRSDAVDRMLEDLIPVLEKDTFTHRRYHNIYFEGNVSKLEPDRPALQKDQTTNHLV